MWQTLLFLFILCQQSLNFFEKNDKDYVQPEGDVFCHELKSRIRRDKDVEILNAEAAIGKSVTLKCGFCNDDEKGDTRVWWKWVLATGSVFEVEFNERIGKTKDGSIVIKKVSLEDVGFFLCRLPYDESLESSLNYLLDIKGTSTRNIDYESWYSYFTKYIMPANAALGETKVKMEQFNYKFEVLSSWAKPSDCQVCVKKPKKTQIAHCRVRVVNLDFHNTNYSIITIPEVFSRYKGSSIQRIFYTLVKTETYLFCGGSLLKNVSSEIAKVVSDIPQFKRESECIPSCPVSGSNVTAASSKTFVTVDEGESKMIPCVGGKLGKIRWEHDGRRIFVSELDGEVAIDHFGNLHLSAASERCSGNYTCYSENNAILLIFLNVRTADDKRYGSEFRRHLFYLFLVTLVSFSIFLILMTGIVVRKKRLLAKWAMERRLQNGDWDEEEHPLLEYDEHSRDSDGAISETEDPSDFSGRSDRESQRSHDSQRSDDAEGSISTERSRRSEK